MVDKEGFGMLAFSRGECYPASPGIITGLRLCSVALLCIVC